MGLPPLPPIEYFAIYQANLPAPPSPILVFSDDDVEVFLHPGPFSFKYDVPNIVLKPPSAEIFGSVSKSIELSSGSYVFIRLALDLRGGSAGRVAAMRVAEIAALFELRHGPLLGERKYQGPVKPTNAMVIMRDTPMRITARPFVDPGIVARDVQADFQALKNLGPQSRDRFRLAARWFSRAVEAENPVDKFLSWWTVLEIYPAQGHMDVSLHVSELLTKKLYSQLDASTVKERLSLGRIEGLRGILFTKELQLCLKPIRRSGMTSRNGWLPSRVFACSY